MCLQKRIGKEKEHRAKQKKTSLYLKRLRIHFPTRTGCLDISDCPGQAETPAWASPCSFQEERAVLKVRPEVLWKYNTVDQFH